ncbi:hypothetical protein GGI17_002716 [Coemansia sp. S146]|nr:hypothetical protein GGI17_002716 [Coemansia sp. S146]
MILTFIAIAYALWEFIDSLDVDPHTNVDDTRAPGKFPHKADELALPDSVPTPGLDDNQPGGPVPGSAHTSAGIKTNSSLHGGGSAKAYDHEMRQALSEVRDALFVPVSDCKRCSRYQKRLGKANMLVASALIDYWSHRARLKINFLDTLGRSARRALHDALCAFNAWEKEAQEHAWAHNLITQSTESGESSGAGAAPASDKSAPDNPAPAINISAVPAIGKSAAADASSVSGKVVAFDTSSSSGKSAVDNPAPAINASAAPAIGKSAAVKTPSASITNPAPASGKGAESGTSSASDVVKPDATPASGKSATVNKSSTDNTFADLLFDKPSINPLPVWPWEASSSQDGAFEQGHSPC